MPRPLQAARVESVAYPANLRLGRVNRVERDDIEANDRCLPLGVTHEQVARRLHDAPALVRVDAFSGRAHGAAAARAHLHDDELPVVATDEIDLAEPATVTTRQDLEPVPLEMSRGMRLPESAPFGTHSALADQAARFGRLRSLDVDRHGPTAAELRER